MAKCLILIVCVIVLLFVAGTIEGSSIQYVSENDLKADPTKCAAPPALKLEDIGHNSNGTSLITLYGQTSSGSLFIGLDKLNGYTSYYLSIRAFEATIKSYCMETLYKTSYNEDPLDLSEFVPIKIQLESGDVSRIKVTLPNAAEFVVIDKPSPPLKEIYLMPFSNWYYNCPPSNVRSTESTSSESSSEENSGDFAFDPLASRETTKNSTVDSAREFRDQ